jgi:hypothetical protein
MDLVLSKVASKLLKFCRGGTRPIVTCYPLLFVTASRRTLQFLIFDRLDSYYRFKVAFHLHIMRAENRGNWYINDGTYQAQHEQGNILQRQFAEHLQLPSRKDSLPVTN